MEPITSANTPKSYLDFDGLGQLKAQARQDAKGALRETAQQFEALFLQMMMKSMREAIVKSDESEDSGKATFEGMFDREVSVQMAKRNTVGLADMLVKNMPQAETPSTAALLEARSAAIPAPMALDRAQLAVKSFALKAPLQSALPLPKTGGMSLGNSKMLLDGSTP
ncbi:MAG: rod-binding protein [Burkholderiales bacterium]|nr:rod-binding protein [Burkholderiales bacterium]